MTFYNLNLITGKKLCQKNSGALVIPTWVLPHSIWHTRVSVPHTTTAVSTRYHNQSTQHKKQNKTQSPFTRGAFFYLMSNPVHFLQNFSKSFKSNNSV